MRQLVHFGGLLMKWKDAIAFWQSLASEILNPSMKNKVEPKNLVSPFWTLHLIQKQPKKDEVHPELEALPLIVIVIDEYADMLGALAQEDRAKSKRVEGLIVRIAQKARAAGMHLIVATQRPSVDVITGLD